MSPKAAMSVIKIQIDYGSFSTHRFLIQQVTVRVRQFNRTVLIVNRQLLEWLVIPV